MAVQMHWVCNWYFGTSSFLNNPVGPDTLSGKFNQVVCLREAVVFILYVLQSWISPVNVDSGHVDAPGNNILVVGGNIGYIEIYLKVLDLAREIGAGYGDVPPWDERGQRICASCRLSCAVGCWCCNGSIRVSED